MNLTVRSWFPPKLRRTLALSFFKTIRPWLEYMSQFRLAHVDDWPRNMRMEDTRGISDNATVDFHDPLFRIGFQLRVARLMHERSLRQISVASGVAESQISLIERGLVKARKKTLERLFKALKADIPLPVYKPFKKRERKQRWTSRVVRSVEDF